MVEQNLLSHIAQAEKQTKGITLQDLRWGSWMNHILTNEVDCTGRTFQLLRD